MSRGGRHLLLSAQSFPEERVFRAHCVDDLSEVDGHSGALEVPVVAGVVYQLRHLAEPQLQAGACHHVLTQEVCC